MQKKEMIGSGIAMIIFGLVLLIPKLIWDMDLLDPMRWNSDVCGAAFIALGLIFLLGGIFRNYAP